MKKSSKKGFTLIELMIVLAIIAILAIVLVPKAGILKTQAKTQGIQTNLNVVRGYLESKMASGIPDNDRTAIYNFMRLNYTGNDSLVNPLTNAKVIGTSALNTYTAGAGDSVAVFAWGGSVTNTLYQTSFPWVTANMKGCVVVVACNDGYFLYGVDNAGAQIDFTIVK